MRAKLGLLALVSACGNDHATRDPFSCDGYVRPARPATTGCMEPSADEPWVLVPCDTGSAQLGVWALDADNLPAYDLLVDERCDAAATAYSPRSPDRAIKDPLHVVGDGFGTVAMAHASGGLDVYMQDRGHAWPVHVDPFREELAPQLGAAVGYLVESGPADGRDRVRSTRFADLPVEGALAVQQRRFGVGYVETVTSLGDLAVTRRTYALPGTRALVTEIAIENRGAAERTVGVVELDDVNWHQLPVELVTSDLLAPSLTRDIDRRRRALAAQFRHAGHYDAAARVASMATTYVGPDPVGPDAVAPFDQHPATLWLAPLDGDAAPDAVWLDEAELWDGVDRAPPVRAAEPGNAATRDVELPGEHQPGVLAVRVPVTVPAGATVVRRFAFGTVPSGADPVAAAEAVRAANPDARSVAAAWRDRLVWAAVPGQPGAGALQRELAWSSYSALALATRDAYHGTRLLGQGGSYKWIHGIDGAIGDYALFAEAMLLIDPELAADTLALSLATQRAPGRGDAGRYPYATTGVGDFTDMVRYDRRSDAYFLLPSQIARYIATARDPAYLDRRIAYWPRADGASGTVLEHLALTQQFADATLGVGAHGLVAMGTNDYADGVLQTATEPATPTGASSTFNAWLLVGGFELAADVVAPSAPALAQRYRDLRADQLARLDQFAWNGMWYERGFVDSGNPLGTGSLYLEPQVLPIVAGAVAPDRRAQLLELVRTKMDTPIGPMTVVPIDPSAPTGDIDEPQVGGVWPVASAWLTEAYAQADPALGYASLVRNTLFAHAEAFPHLWYGVTSGPDSYYGPDAERPGEADAHLATALTDYPVFNTHAHTSVLRALVAVAGIRATAAGYAIAPRFPTETFAVTWPRFALHGTPDAIRGALTPVAGGTVAMRVRLPSGLAAGALVVTVDGAPVAATRDGADVTFAIATTAGTESTWAVTR